MKPEQVVMDQQQQKNTVEKGGIDDVKKLLFIILHFYQIHDQRIMIR
jgi:hypothetical protein